LNCINYQVSSTGGLTKNSDYSAGQLYVTKTTDEDNNVSYQFTDQQGRILLTRQMDGNETYDTYYVYDNRNNLSFVLQPMYQEPGANLDLNSFQYKYDSRNRCIEKKLPGVQSIYYVYDRANNLIFSQDGEQRDRNEWTFSIPDVLGRTVLTGTCKNSLNHNLDPLGTIVVKAVWENIDNTSKGYTIKGISLTSPVIYSASYYDNYDFIGKNSVPTTIQYVNQPSGFGSRYTESANGFLTGKITAELSTSGVDGYLYSAFYYDNKGHVIQSQSTNHLNGFEKEYIAYNLFGDPVKKQHVHSKGADSHKELYTYEYDHMKRLIKTTHKLNGNGEVILSENTYNKVGHLESNKKYGNTSLNSNLVSTYTHNVRSWLKSVSVGTLFTQNLYYNESYGGSTAQYNGNISAMSWKAFGDNNLRGYAFSYDDLSRLANAKYLVDGSASSHYNTSYSYDKQGNIKSLVRYGKISTTAYGIMDNLTYTYSGNQLHNVSDTGTDPLYAGAFNFVDGNKTSTQEYQYHKNGNLKLDYNKKIALIQYNNLNLPNTLQFTNGHRTDYLYSADGAKLKVVHKTAIANVVVTMGNLKDLATNEVSRTDRTDYCGNMVYENDNLSKILTDDGYITLNGTIPTYHYYLKDHQGNNRVVTYWNGSQWIAEQVNHYYPFGGLFAEGITTSSQPYKYNGKELDRMYGLDWYDYEARMYDSALGRFMVMDPMAEEMYSWSTYTYCLDNPIKHVDKDGKIPLLAGLIGGATDYIIQVAVNKIGGKSWSESLTNVDTKSIMVSAGTSMAGIGLGNVVNKGIKAVRMAQTSSKVAAALEMAGKVVVDATLSVTSQYIKEGEVSGKEVAVDVGAGYGAEMVGDFVKSLKQNSPEAKLLYQQADHAKRVAGDNPRASRAEKLRVANEKAMKYGDKTANSVSIAISNISSRTVNGIIEDDENK